MLLDEPAATSERLMPSGVKGSRGSGLPRRRRWVLRTWRRHVRDGHLVAAQAPQFVPVRLTDPPPLAPATAPTVNNPLAADAIEIVLPDGSRVRVGSSVNLNALRRVVTALRG